MDDDKEWKPMGFKEDMRIFDILYIADMMHYNIWYKYWTKSDSKH